MGICIDKAEIMKQLKVKGFHLVKEVHEDLQTGVMIHLMLDRSAQLNLDSDETRFTCSFTTLVACMLHLTTKNCLS